MVLVLPVEQAAQRVRTALKLARRLHKATGSMLLPAPGVGSVPPLPQDPHPAASGRAKGGKGGKGKKALGPTLAATQARLTPTAPVAKAEAPHQYSSTQVNLPPALARRVKALAATIPDDNLAADGREDQPHCTVLYGLHAAEPAAVARTLAGSGPATATLGKTRVFAAAETGGDYDVVYISVDSADLRALNKTLRTLPHTSTHPRYKPHVTVAYVKAGRGRRYAGLDTLDGQTLTVGRIAFCDKGGQQTEISLGEGEKNAVSRRVRKAVFAALRTKES